MTCSLNIGNKKVKYPIIQGGMGIGVSLHKLAGAVAKEGGIGVISTADIGYQEEDFQKNPLAANLRAIEKEVKLARKISPNGVIAANVMVALTHYEQIVEECVKQKVDLIISGAGLPKDLPKFVKGSHTKIAPIVSSSRAFRLLYRIWSEKYDYIPDLVIIEGPEAGGHLGFKEDELKGESKPSLTVILKEVLEEIEKTGKNIPVIVAGGVFTGDDIKYYLSLGASGVQMATRFVATNECDASLAFKEAYIQAREEDIVLVKSPVGMPGRALNNSFIKKISASQIPISHCYNCIRTCDRKTIPYCITQALINAVQGNLNHALIFCGSNVRSY